MFTYTRNMIPHQTLYDPENLRVLSYYYYDFYSFYCFFYYCCYFYYFYLYCYRCYCYCYSSSSFSYSFNLYLSSGCRPKPGNLPRRLRTSLLELEGGSVRLKRLR